MRCFYPGNVICLNALCTPGARPAAVLIFLRLLCQNEPGYLWESRPAGSSCPHPGIWTGLLQFIGGQCLWNVWRRCVVKVNTVSAHINRDGSVAFLHGSRGRESSLKLHYSLAAAVWSWFYKKCSHRKYLKIVTRKQDCCWWEQSGVRTDVKQHGVALTHCEECFRASRTIKYKPGWEKEGMENRLSNLILPSSRS